MANPMPYPMIRALPTFSCSIMRSCLLRLTAAPILLVALGRRED
jgi:hypothetical protein